jgi:hypothetical protein
MHLNVHFTAVHTIINNEYINIVKFNVHTYFCCYLLYVNTAFTPAPSDSHLGMVLNPKVKGDYSDTKIGFKTNKSTGARVYACGTRQNYMPSRHVC